MTTIKPINPLPGLAHALHAASEDQQAVFNTQVMEPLRPFWEPFLAHMPQPATIASDPLLDAALRFNYYTPQHNVAAGLAALQRLQAAGTWATCMHILERAIAALDPQAHGLDLAEVLFTLVVGDPDQLREDAGLYTGYGAQPGMVMVLAWPTEYNLPRLPTAVAHEFNHNVRFLYEPFPFDCPLGQYLVAEGLAESFGVELCGMQTVSPCVSALTEAQIAALKPRYHEQLELRGFNDIRGYIFGDWAAEAFGYVAQNIPNYAGYSLGYELVQAYLRTTGSSAAQATYVPWRTIVEQSRFFAA